MNSNLAEIYNSFNKHRLHQQKIFQVNNWKPLTWWWKHLINNSQMIIFLIQIKMMPEDWSSLKRIWELLKKDQILQANPMDKIILFLKEMKIK
jgi:hypothetical protein